MARIETAVAKGYGSNFGGKLAFLRELMANGIDAETRNKHTGRGAFNVGWSRRHGQLTLTNWGVKVSTSALLMGTSESREDDHCIGQFGEGLVMALKGLCELGHEVQIINGDESWKPRIELSRTFEGAEVLVVNTRKCDDRGAFIVKVKGLTEEDFEQLNGLFLTRHPDYNEADIVGSLYSDEKVLLDPAFRGHVYNKGVLLLKRDDLLFGYNISNENNINLDRSVMSDYDLSAQVLDVLDKVSGQSTFFQDTLVNMLFTEPPECLEMKNTYSSLRYRTALSAKAAEEFGLRYGPNAIPVSEDNQIERASRYGLRGVVVPPTLWGILTGSGGGFSCLGDIAEAAEREIMEDTPLLTAKPVRNIEMAEYLLSCVGWNTKLRPVVFGGNELVAQFIEPDEEDAFPIVYIAKRVAEESLGSIIQAALSVRPMPGDNCPSMRERQAATIETFSAIIDYRLGE